MPYHTMANSPSKGSPPPVHSPGTLPFSEPDAPGPVSAFAVLVRATAARDFSTATRARKQLRAFGWSVGPCGKGGLP